MSPQSLSSEESRRELLKHIEIETKLLYYDARSVHKYLGETNVVDPGQVQKLISNRKGRSTIMRIMSVALVSLSLWGCGSTQEIHITQPPVKSLDVTGVPTAGAISIDITPPPGMPMGGYSMLANRGQGFRTRIKARVIYLNDGKGHSIVLVQTDLPSGSLLLHHKIAEAVSERTGLRPGDIAITASHSHSISSKMIFTTNT